MKTVKALKSASRVALFTLSFLFIFAQSANAAMRIIVRSDYGKKGLAPITDRLDGLGHTVTGQPLGGAYDLVYQENSQSRVAEVYQCPTAKKCQNKTDCLMRPEFWSCQQLYQADKQEFCRFHKAGNRAYTAVSWVASQVVGSIVTGQIVFLNRGIGLMALNIADVVDGYHTVRDLIEASCSSNGLGEALQRASSEGLIFSQEQAKEQVHTALTIFKSSNTISEEGSFPASLQNAGKLKPLRSVILDPSAIDNGMLKVTDQP